MSKNIFVTSLTTALLALPLLAGCKNGTGTIIIPPGGLSLPDCAAGQFLTVGADKNLNCTTAGAANLTPKTCPSGYAESIEGGQFVCVALGTGSTNADLSAAITNLVSKTTNLQTQINNFGGGGGAAKFCGLTPATKGKIVSGTTVGIAAAAKQCEAVTGCGTGAHMCTVYEMYESAAAGVLNATNPVVMSWIYMPSWKNVATSNSEPEAALADNCGSYIYDTSDNAWYGTAVKWEKLGADTDFALKFYTGTATMATRCGQSLPTACCK